MSLRKRPSIREEEEEYLNPTSASRQREDISRGPVGSEPPTFFFSYLLRFLVGTLRRSRLQPVSRY